MARLDIYPLPGRHTGGYVVDIQTDLLRDLATRVVVPLLPANAAPPPIRDLNPVISMESGPHIFLTQALSSIPAKELRDVVGSLKDKHDIVTRAIDILLVGY